MELRALVNKTMIWVRLDQAIVLLKDNLVACIPITLSRTMQCDKE